MKRVVKIIMSRGSLRSSYGREPYTRVLTPKIFSMM